MICQQRVVRRDDYRAAFIINFNLSVVKSDFFYPMPSCISFVPRLIFTEHGHVRAHTNTVYYAVTLPDPLRQLCISVWLMRVISPKQQNDHFGGERYRPSLLPLSSLSPIFFFFLGYKKGKKDICYRASCIVWNGYKDKQLYHLVGFFKVNNLIPWIQSNYWYFSDDSYPCNRRYFEVGLGGVVVVVEVVVRGWGLVVPYFFLDYHRDLI